MTLFGKKQPLIKKARKRDMPDGLWLKCPACNEMVFREEQEKALRVCPLCGHHFTMSRAERLAMLADPGSFVEWDRDVYSIDFLGFVGAASYQEKLEANRRKTGEVDAVTCGRARLEGRAIALGVMDFEFLGASMGSVVGEKITRLIERGTVERLPVIIVCASGGARMYEGMMSLMQMAKTSGALARHAEAGLPYIPVLTHPTTAGVMASFASLGDIILAEPGALIGFAGARVIKETIQHDLPPGFQRPEFLLEHGLLDQIVPRGELKATLARLLDFLCSPLKSSPPPELPA
ncbi:MAG: acetyl-CoA carboxylase carboxyltransferase subunit beta [Kiritimatiellae bacterium]|jgi:acetyl-CoA carboxylase carboxyl transferase subunit beta|nr:acetyl-CoA carboxylase carboxyltransferase subunit beta [Kiritimatiellia bacterium]NLD90642.1 acetyl-CoA carboxylase carboxyltransferase subunit beta [Lentisphaerota bacterium]HOU21338.1 acetyl-CoA carboxylase, carboxyltransferase subunit beta [Kiritimatiellia bacterium]HPC19375.1 acetyl-CoA carboxylase, carboxyltransferase subunit beta [Kiritimatiellia bacterium]